MSVSKAFLPVDTFSSLIRTESDGERAVAACESEPVDEKTPPAAEADDVRPDESRPCAESDGAARDDV